MNLSKLNDANDVTSESGMLLITLKSEHNTIPAYHFNSEHALIRIGFTYSKLPVSKILLCASLSLNNNSIDLC